MPTLPFRPAASSALWALAVLLALIAVSVAWTAPTAQAATVSFAPSFSPSQFLGEGSSLSAQLTFTGTEYHGSPAPVTEVVVHLPAGVGGTSAGFPTCSEQILAEVYGPGTAGCPAGSLAGPVSSIGLDAEAGYSLDGHIVAERVHETGTMQAVFANPEETSADFLFYIEAPGIQAIVPAYYVEDAPPYGRELRLELPLLETLPGQPYASITSLTVALGASREEDGQRISSLTIPQACPSSGMFPWAADVTYTINASPIERTHEHMTAETACPASSGKSATTTTLQASTASPQIGETVAYFATVTPTAPQAPLPSGSVTFLDEGTPIGGCTAQVLTPGTVSSTASCQLSYPTSGTHRITVRYGGDAGYFGSASSAQTITVSAVELAHESPPSGQAASTSGSSTGTGSGSNAGKAVATISSAQLKASLSAQLIPSGKAASIAALLKHGGYAMPFRALEAGTATIDWYELPSGAKLASKTKGKPVLVATGKLTFAAPGLGKVMVRLTVQGKKLLKHGKRVRLEAEGRFQSPSGVMLLVERALQLH